MMENDNKSVLFSPTFILLQKASLLRGPFPVNQGHRLKKNVFDVVL